MYIKLTIFIVLLCALANAQITRTYENCAVLSLQDEGKIYWTVKGTTIDIAIEAAFPNGWFAVGISPSASMTNADAWAVAWDSTSTVQNKIADLWLSGEDQPDFDDSDDLTNRLVTRNTSIIAGEFSRALNTGDSEDRAITPGTAQTLIWAGYPTRPFGKKFDLHRANGRMITGSTQIDFGAASSCETKQGNNEWTSSSKDFSVKWELDATKTEITFTVTGSTAGWVGFGISTRPSMTGCDMYVGWVTGSQLTLTDSYASGQSQPSPDTTNSITNPTGSETAGVTTFTFTRKLDTGDTQDQAITDTSLYIVYALSSTDGNSPSSYNQHQITGAGQVNFLSGNTTGGTGGKPAGGDVTSVTGYTVSDNGFSLTWKVDGDTILFQMSAPTTGWLSFGIANKPSMVSSDCYVGWVNADASANLLDTWASAQDIPSEDTSRGGTDDTILHSATEASGTTTIIFSRKLVTGDTNDYDISDQYVYMIYATGTSDGGAGIYPKHTKTGSIQVNFLTGGSIANKFKLSPGQLLVILMMAILVAVVIFRSTRMTMKWRKKKQQKKSKAAYSSPNEIPMSQESQDIETAKPSSTSPAEMDAKKSHGHIRNYLLGMLHWRIPQTQKNLESIVLAFLYIVINIACLFIGTEYYKSFGSLVAANSFLVTIPATRNSLLVTLLGIPFDRTIMFHRWLGRFNLILLTIHFILALVFWSQTGLSLSTQLKISQYLIGLFGWISLVIVFSTSVEPIRRKKFEVFYYAHILVVAFFILGCLHNANYIPFAIASVVVYGLDRVFRLLWGTIPHKTTKLVCKDTVNKVIQVRFNKNKLAKFFKMYKVGQYVFVNFPGVSVTEWHPFSISSGPDESEIELNIKGLGNFTEKLYEATQKKTQMYIRVDGPYGNLNFNYRRFPAIILVAGGIGVTPVMSILKDVYRTGQVERPARRSCIESVHFVWTVPSQDQYAWFGEDIKELVEASQGKKSEFFPEVYLSKEKTAEGILKTGRPKYSEIFAEVAGKHKGQPILVFVCGPTPMVKDCWDTVSARNKSGARFVFHKEVFEF